MTEPLTGKIPITYEIAINGLAAESEKIIAAYELGEKPRKADGSLYSSNDILIYRALKRTWTDLKEAVRKNDTKNIAACAGIVKLLKGLKPIMDKLERGEYE